MRVIYLAHPYGGSAENRERAKRWFKWAAVHMRVSPVADWIIMTELLDETDRELGLACDVELVERCDEVWLVGGEVSPGMRVESASARVVRDLTSLGPEPPAGPIDGWVGKCVIKYDGDKVENLSGVFLAEIAESLKPKAEGSRQMNLGSSAVGQVVHYYLERKYDFDRELRGPFAAIIVEVIDVAAGAVRLAVFSRGEESHTVRFTADFSETPRAGHWTWRPEDRR